MKQAVQMVWQGLTHILVGIANWIAQILSMSDQSRYGKWLQRIVGTCITVCLVLFTLAALTQAYEGLCNRLSGLIIQDGADYIATRLSPNVTYYKSTQVNNGYVQTNDGEVTIKSIEWIYLPKGQDSLVCYTDGKKYGYFNRNTGRIVVKPQYLHASMFSEGLASVDDDGWINFIDGTGKVVIETGLPCLTDQGGYCFRDGYCILPNDLTKKFGIMDRQGNWVLQPEYAEITYHNECWMLDNGKQQCVLDKQLRTLVPYQDGLIWVYTDYIGVTLSNHILQRYNHMGELINDFFINDVESLYYKTEELRYGYTKNYDDNGTLISETQNDEPTPIHKTAKCKRYEAETGWYGLLSAEGKVLTSPSYSQIIAIDYDLYLCKDGPEEGILVNGKGEIVSP